MAMSDTEILEGIAAIAREELGFEGEISSELRLIEDLELDSIRRLTLAVAVENRFRVLLDPEDEAAFVTVGDLVRAVARKAERSET